MWNESPLRGEARRFNAGFFDIIYGLIGDEELRVFVLVEAL